MQALRPGSAVAARQWAARHAAEARQPRVQFCPADARLSGSAKRDCLSHKFVMTAARTNDRAQVYTAEDVIDEFGVAKNSYEPVSLPLIRAFEAVCHGLGPPSEVLSVESEALPKARHIIMQIRPAWSSGGRGRVFIRRPRIARAPERRHWSMGRCWWR